jgi:hypothetical protein
MLTALILICSASIAPNSDECTRYNASTIIRVPTEFGSPATCFMQAQAYLAQSPEGQELDGDARVKLVCVRSEMVAGIPLQRR